MASSDSKTDTRLWQIFQTADEDGSGSISKRELYAALDLAGLGMTLSEKLEAYRAGDKDGSGSIEWEEFKMMALKFKQLRNLPPPPPPPQPKRRLPKWFPDLCAATRHRPAASLTPPPLT